MEFCGIHCFVRKQGEKVAGDAVFSVARGGACVQKLIPVFWLKVRRADIECLFPLQGDEHAIGYNGGPHGMSRITM